MTTSPSQPPSTAGEVLWLDPLFRLIRHMAPMSNEARLKYLENHVKPMVPHVRDPVLQKALQHFYVLQTERELKRALNM